MPKLFYIELLIKKLKAYKVCYNVKLNK